MAGKPDTWRLDFFANREDKDPIRSEIIEAMNEGDAADIAAAKMGIDLRVDITRTVVRPSSN